MVYLLTRTSDFTRMPLCILQSWTKVLGTVLQYSYFHVISRFPLKTVHPFRNSLVVLPPPTLYKVETRKKFWIHASNIVCGVRLGELLDLCELENAPETQKCPKTFVHDCIFLWRTDTIVVSKLNKPPSLLSPPPPPSPRPPQMGLK